MEVIKRKKAAQRASFTKAYNKLEILLKDDNPEHTEIDMCLCLFKQKANALELIHNAYLDNLSDEKEFETEFNLVEEYREKALRIEIKAQRLLDNCKKSNDCESTHSDNSHQFDDNKVLKSMCYKLPEVELYKFGGDLKDWLTFWNQFKNIHENANLTNADKFHYLIQSTKVKSLAREIVESFPITDENYSLAIDSLKERFGRNELLIDFYVRDLLKLVLNNAAKRECDSISTLYNKLSTQLRSLGTLGVTSDMCGIVLFPLVESALPVDILRSFERQRKSLEKDASDLDAIVSFLKTEVQSEEKIKLSRRDICSVFPERRISAPRQVVSNARHNNASATELVNCRSNCSFCSKEHETRFCKKVFYMPMNEKLSAIKNRGLCRVCLMRGHLSNSCRSNVKCQLCSKRHLKFMCPTLEINKSNEIDKQSDENEKDKTVDTLHSRVTKEVFLQTLVVFLKVKNTETKLRILIDTGSQRSYILKSTAEEMGFDFQDEEEFRHSLFGGKKTEMRKHKCYKIYLDSLDGNYRCNLDALDQDVICDDISTIKYGEWMHELKKKGIYITDTSKNAGRPIEVLLGADVAGKLFTGKQEQLKSGLVALDTKLGWTLIGKVPQFECHDNVNMTVVSMLSQEDLSVSSLWDLELLGIRDPVEQSSKEDAKRAVMIHFQETVKQGEDGRYQVNLPWKPDHAFLPDNYEISVKRLESTFKKLERTGYREKYHQVFEEWLQEGVIEEIPEKELSTTVSHYLPHRPVIKEMSMTSSLKIRPVFDASAKVANYPSLNDCLETGINFIETIPSILARFRLNKIGVISDIRRAFLQISLNETDQNFLRFLWYDRQNALKIFRHRRVVFGLTSSPFLLMAVIHHHLSKDCLKSQYSEELLGKLRDSFYVDNCVTSVQTISELENFIKAATEIMAEGKFDLRGWESTGLPVGPSETSKAHVLGLTWDKNSDTLEIDCESLNFEKIEKLTKRKILSIVSRIFDPIGFIAPALIQPKLLLQAAWKNKEHWDSELHEDIKKKFIRWFKDLHHLNDIKIPRWLGATNFSCLSVHTFVDASQTAYSACIFLRCELPDNTVKVQLIQAKSRIAPLKKITIPRLELMGATIGARLFQSVKETMKFENFETYFWSDSSTVLTWIKRKEQWSVFVNNRISEIRKITESEDWFHVPGEQNVADLLSRGCGIKQLLKSQWWLGPEWLKKSKDQWPKSVVNINEDEIQKEKRKIVVSANNTEFESIVTQLAERISSFSKMTRVLAWILRFRSKAEDLRTSKNLTKEEIIDAQKVLFRVVQAESFSYEEGRKSLGNFQVYEDEEKLLRLKTRLTDENETPDFISPLILPSKHPVVRRLIEEQHILNKHAGTFTLLTILRERYWILKGRKIVRSVIQKCVFCRRYQAKSLRVPFPPLPKDRTNLSHPFQVTGVDLAGPLLSKTREKFWIVIFTYAVYRAVHLELVPFLSTAAFIQAMRRFIARRGRICVIYSDNGTNFVGLNSAMKKLDWIHIQKVFEVNQIRWKFNPPTAPWWGGFWERLIRILKDLLRKNLGRAALRFDELQTLICECEMIMNTRPLTYVSEEAELRTLTPSMFLQSLLGNEVPELDSLEETSLVKRWNYVQKLRNNLKQRFKKEYLGFLRSSNVHYIDSVKVGDIVLIGSDDKKRLEWPLAQVLELFPGRDKIHRLVKVKTAKGILLRPIQRLYPLELRGEERIENINFDSEKANSYAEVGQINKKVNITENESSLTDDVKNPATTEIITRSRSGRIVKPPKRLNI